MKKGATRSGDTALCNSHGSVPVGPTGSSNVFVNGSPMMRQTDPIVCPSTNIIVTGAEWVNVNKKHASRLWEAMLHPGGHVFGSSSDVFIGGPSVGMIVGPSYQDGMDACTNAANGREGGSTQQSYGNCGVESARQIVNKKRNPPVNENDMLHEAQDHGWADKDEKPDEAGGTTPNKREKILRHYGVESEQQEQTPENIAQALAEGKGVITSHVSGKLWGDPKYKGGHAVLVTGVKYDANGKIVSYRINDTGRVDKCSTMVLADQFEGSLKKTPFGGVKMNVTKEKIW